MILDTPVICREKFIFCHQIKNFRLSEMFSKYISVSIFRKIHYRCSENSGFENCNQNHSKIPVEKRASRSKTNYSISTAAEQRFPPGVAATSIAQKIWLNLRKYHFKHLMI